MATRCASIFIILQALLVQIALPSKSTSGGLLTTLAQGIDTQAADTVRALDTNGNGKVDRSEITVFAKSQGLSSEEVLADFQELDANKDGELDASEIGGLLGEPKATPSVGEPLAVNSVTTLAAEPSKALAPAADPAPKAQAVAKVTATEAVEAEREAKASPSAMASSSSVDLDIAALERDSQEQAGSIMASRLAERAQVLLARSIADGHKAETFDAEVRNLRGNATALAHSVNEETRNVAKDATAAVAQKSMTKLQKLRAQEREAEAAADEHRAEARKAMGRVRKAQASLQAS